MKLIVGLGNPGKQYDNTRHNVGFNLIDKIVEEKSLGKFSNKFQAEYIETIINGEKVVLIKPSTYMNLSGISVKKFIDYYKIDLKNVLVIHDDLDMDLGRIKIVFNSSSGGHNGIKNIEENLSGQRNYYRLKIGISNNKDVDTKDYVLGKFDKVSKEKLSIIYNNLINIVDDFISMTPDLLMNKYNKK